MTSAGNDYSSRESARTSDYIYWAFISYSHHDERWGRWLHKSLEQYRVPKRFVGKSNSEGATYPKRLFPIFRDMDELASSADLGNDIHDALRQSRFLIVICSPNAVTSKWVDAEIRYFKALGREQRVLALLVNGEPYASEGGAPEMCAKECFPQSLRYRVSSSGKMTRERIEPLAADVRSGRRGRSDAVLRIIAGLLNVGYDDLRRRQSRRNKIRASVASFTLIGLLVVTALILMQVEKLKRDRVALLPKPPPAELLAEQTLLENFIQQLGQPQEIKITTSDYTQEITFGSVALFQLNNTELTLQGKEVIGEFAQYVYAHKLKFLREVQVYAHTDSLPIKTPQGRSNWELSALRATSIVRFMEEMGIDPKEITLTPIAPGEYQPAVDEDSDIAQSLNRRVRIRLIYAATHN